MNECRRRDLGIHDPPTWEQAQTILGGVMKKLTFALADKRIVSASRVIDKLSRRKEFPTHLDALDAKHVILGLGCLHESNEGVQSACFAASESVDSMRSHLRPGCCEIDEMVMVVRHIGRGVSRVSRSDVDRIRFTLENVTLYSEPLLEFVVTIFRASFTTAKSNRKWLSGVALYFLPDQSYRWKDLAEEANPTTSTLDLPPPEC